jgi:putative acetyltransferase
MLSPLRRAMLIRLDDLTGPEILALLEAHLRSMYELSAPESVHALNQCHSRPASAAA